MIDALPEANFTSVQIGAMKFRAFVIGSGKPVLLLHGFPDDLSVWRKMIPGLVCAGYQVIAFDQRGCGETDAPRGTEHYAIRKIVDDTPQILDALGVRGKVAVIGHDWGSVIGWVFALRYPERVAALVAVSVGHPQSYGRAGIEQKFVRGLYTLWFQLRGFAEWRLLRRNGQGLREWMRHHEDGIEAVHRMSRPGRLSATLNWYRANLIGIVFDRWPHCRVPTLGVWSDRDALLTEAQMQNSSDFVSADWRYERVDHCGHWIPLDAPDKLVALAVAWFRKHA